MLEAAAMAAWVVFGLALNEYIMTLPDTHLFKGFWLVFGAYLIRQAEGWLDQIDPLKRRQQADP